MYLLTHLSPRVCLDLRKLELGVVGVHLSDLLPGWRAQNLKRKEQKRMEHLVSESVCEETSAGRPTVTPSNTLMISTN